MESPLHWTVPDTYAASHIGETAKNAGAGANKAETNKIVKYNSVAIIYHTITIAIETSGPWNSEASEFSRQENRRSYTGTFGNAISIPTVVHRAAEGKRDSVQKHV